MFRVLVFRRSGIPASRVLVQAKKWVGRAMGNETFYGDGLSVKKKRETSETTGETERNLK